VEERYSLNLIHFLPMATKSRILSVCWMRTEKNELVLWGGSMTGSIRGFQFDEKKKYTFPAEHEFSLPEELKTAKSPLPWSMCVVGEELVIGDSSGKVSVWNGRFGTSSALIDVSSWYADITSVAVVDPNPEMGKVVAVGPAPYVFVLEKLEGQWKLTRTMKSGIRPDFTSAIAVERIVFFFYLFSSLESRNDLYWECGRYCFNVGYHSTK